MADTIKISIKTLKKEEFFFDVSPSDSVLSLKQKIQERLSHEVEAQKLIFTGKILTDDQSLSSVGIVEGSFLVLLPSGRKPAAPAVAKPASPSPTPAPAPATPAPAPAPAPATPAPATPSPAPAAGGDLAASGPQYEAKLSELLSMGFPRAQAEQALAAAFNDLARATDYLLNGIPDSALATLVSAGGAPQRAPGQRAALAPLSPNPGSPAAAPSPQAGGGDGGSLWEMAAQAPPSGAPAGGAGGSLDFLRQLPYFNQLRAAVQANPNMLPLILQQLAQSQPQLLALIQTHQQEFLELLSEPVDPSALEGLPGMGPAGGNVVQIQLTPAEHEAVVRIMGMGFSRNRVLQAFVACERNEENTIQFLLDTLEDDDDVAADEGGFQEGGLEDDDSFDGSEF